MKTNTITNRQQAIDIIRGCGGIIKTASAIKKGIHPATFYTLRDSGVLNPLSRGTFCLTEYKALSNPDFVAVATRAPKALICLISALSFHEITTQIPHSVSIAVEINTRKPKIDYPPVSIYSYGTESFNAGIEEHLIDGIKVRIYDSEKTIADCFKFRNKIGMDVVLEAVKLYRQKKKLNIEKLMEYSRICRVEKIIKPYLEITL